MTKIFTKQFYENALKKHTVKEDRVKTWSHWCPEEKGWIENLSGEPCNWCDTPETDENRDD